MIGNNDDLSSDGAYISEEEGDFDNQFEIEEFDQSATDFSRDLSAKITTSIRPTSAVMRDSPAKSTSSIMKKVAGNDSPERNSMKRVSFN